MNIPHPPPPPPSHCTLPNKQSAVLSYRQLDHYKLPMYSEYVPAWTKVLRDCGYPADTLVVDFESYFDSDYSMKDLSTVEYILDKRWEVLGCAFLSMQGQYPFAEYERATYFAMGEEAVENYLRQIDWNRVTVVMQHSSFDASILALRYNIFPPFIVDTLCLARAWNSRQRHGLGVLAKQFGLIDKGDTKQFGGVSFKRRYVRPKGRGSKMPVPRPLITDEQVGDLVKYASNDAMREWELFTILLPRLSNPKTELRLQKHTLDMVLKPSLRVDEKFGNELASSFDAEVTKALEACGCAREEISGDKSFSGLISEALKLAGDNPQTYFKPMKRGYMMAEAKTDPERELLLNHADARVRLLMQARIAISSWPNHAARVRGILSYAAARDGWLGIPTKYHGAHTGRNSGADGINLLNLPKNGLLAKIREIIVAPPGETLVIVDAAQIEARGTAWIAGQDDLVERFARNEDPYIALASKIVGYPIRKPSKTDLPVIAKRLKNARQLGKIGILGAGYGMGKDRCFEYANGEPYNCGIDQTTADKIIDTYRRENAKIVQFWKDVERSFVYTAKYHRPNAMLRGLRFDSTGDCDVILTLPSGRELHYLQVRVKPGKYADTAEVYNSMTHSWEYIWGGTITENCLAGDTPVLTKRGWIPLASVTIRDKVWDGIEWVKHGGVVCRGEHPVIVLDSLRLTPDHQIRTTDGWTNASHAQGLRWAPVGRPDYYVIRWAYWKALAMGRYLYMWLFAVYSGTRYSDRKGRVLSVSAGAGCRTSPSSPSVGQHENTVLESEVSGVSQLRRSGHKNMRAMARRFRQLLGRHVANVYRWIDARPNRQQRTLRTGKLPMGDCERAIGEHSQTTTPGIISRDSRHARAWASGNIQQTLSGAVPEVVYDLLNCGPRHQFVVRGGRIVHNCVQAFCRDVLMEAIVRLEDQGVHTCFHCYDEIVTSVPIADAPRVQKVIEAELSTTPTWATGLPLAAEGFIYDRYRKG